MTTVDMISILAGQDLDGVLGDLGPIEVGDDDLDLDFDDAPWPHDANLAEVLSDTQRNSLARQILDLVEDDARAREKWSTLARKGHRMLGLAIDDVGQRQAVVEKSSARDKSAGDLDVEWASRACHPVLAEAIVRFQAQAIAELFPASGPAKGSVIAATKTTELEEQASRVATLINWIATDECPEWGDQTDKLLFICPLEGVCYTKVSPSVDTYVSRMLVRAHDFFVPRHATTFHEAVRVTHRMRWHPSRIKDLQDSGYLLDGVDVLAFADPEPRDSVDVETDKTVGLDSDGTSQDRDDDPIEILEVYLRHDMSTLLPGEPKGRNPYVMTFGRRSEQLLAIRRNWSEYDSRRRPWRLLTQWPYILGNHAGPYAYGLTHMIGGLSETAHILLRSALRIAAKSSDPSGFIQDAILNNKNFDRTPMEPGELRATPLSADDIRKAIFLLPSGDAGALAQVLEFIVGSAQRFASTADLQVGDGDSRAPVGTTLALIEQGSRVYTAIHGRLHRAQRRELHTVMLLIGAYVDPDAHYPFQVDDQRRRIIDDFDDRIDVEPVSDPRVASNTQRIARAQALFQMATEWPEQFDRRAVARQMVLAVGVSDPDDVLKQERAAVRRDAISEDMVLLYGQPIRAYPDQDHVAHIAVHMSFFDGLPPDAKKVLQAPFMAHLGEHFAFQHRLQMEQVISQITGIPLGGMLPPPPEPPIDGDMAPTPAMDPQFERLIDAAAAQAAQAMAAQQPAGQDGPSPDQIKAQAAEHKAQIDEARLKLDQGKEVARIKMQEAKIKADAALAGEKIDLERDRLALERAKAIAQISMDAARQRSAAALDGARIDGERDRHDSEIAARLAIERARLDQASADRDGGRGAGGGGDDDDDDEEDEHS